jgi:hypothetical protein
MGLTPKFVDIGDGRAYEAGSGTPHGASKLTVARSTSTVQYHIPQIFAASLIEYVMDDAFQFGLMTGHTPKKARAHGALTKFGTFGTTEAENKRRIHP